MFGKKDPICGMREKPGAGFRHDGHWFCSEACYEQWKSKKASESKGNCGCCHGRHGK